MKKFNPTAVLALLVALVMAFSVLPFAAIAEKDNKVEVDWTVPAGYNEYEYNKIVEFLEQTSPDGVKNGVILGGETYDPNDPNTWGWGFPVFTQIDGEYRATEINSGYLWLYGDLDLENFDKLQYINFVGGRLDSLNIRGCSSLISINCGGNLLTELDVTGCTSLTELLCYANQLTELDVSSLTSLYYLDCGANLMTSLDLSNNHALHDLWITQSLIESVDVSGCPDLYAFIAQDNSLVNLDLSANLQLHSVDCMRGSIEHVELPATDTLLYVYFGENELYDIDLSHTLNIDNLDLRMNNLSEIDMSAHPIRGNELVQAIGGGYVGFYSYGGFDIPGGELSTGNYDAEPLPGYQFDGWYDENGVLLSTELEYHSFGEETRSTYAHFSRIDGGVIGDANNDGSVDNTDVLLVMRYSMGLETIYDALEICDINHDGTVDLADALIIARYVMGIIPEL